MLCRSNHTAPAVVLNNFFACPRRRREVRCRQATGVFEVKRATLLVMSFVALMGLFKFSLSHAGPPRDETLVNTFRGHEELRNLLQEDKKLRRVASWGFEIWDSPIVMTPPTAELSSARYQKYMDLLAKVHGLALSRSRGDHPDSCIFVWASGWAADTEHIAICWLDHEPEKQPESDSRQATEERREKHSRFVFEHIEDKWYLQKER
jgi:hypothetical protein